MSLWKVNPPKKLRYLRFLAFANTLLVLISVVFLNPILFPSINANGKEQATLVPMVSQAIGGEITAALNMSSGNPSITAENDAKTNTAVSTDTGATPEIAAYEASAVSDADGDLVIATSLPTTQNEQLDDVGVVATGIASANSATTTQITDTPNQGIPNGIATDNPTAIPSTVVPDPYLTVQNPPNGADITHDVIAELQQTGSAPVMIYLRDAHALQTLQSAASIATLQDDLVAAFRAGAFQLEAEFSETPILVGEISPEALTTLTTHPAVASVQLDYPTVAHGLDNANLQLIGADKVQAGTPTLASYNGDGIVVAVLDTGMDTVHPQLVDNVLMQGSTKIQHCTADDCWNGSHDTDGHGTHVSGIIADIAPNVKILPIRVFNRDGSGKASYWVDALEWVLKNHQKYGIDVISMSLGTSSAYSAACDVDFNGAYDLVTKLVDAGIPVFSSTGNNSNQDVVSAPACLQPVIAVSSVYQPPMPTAGYDAADFDAIYANCYNGEPAAGELSIPCYASTGYQTDLLAPGIANSTWLHYQDGGTKTLYGTSQSAPMAAAVAALMLQAKPNLLPIQIEQILESTGQKIWDNRSMQSGKTGSYIFSGQFSYPLINAKEAVEAALKVEFECRNVKNLDKSECDALVAFYSAATTGGAWVNSSGWLQDLDPCTWRGIKCTSDGKHIEEIRLSANGLTGSLSPQIVAFSQLQVLDVSYNALGGEFPAGIAGMSLDTLNVNYNKLHFRTLNEIQLSFMQTKAVIGWNNTQTVPPTNAGTNASSTTHFSIFFAPVNYPTAIGYYEAGCGFNQAGPYNVLSQTFLGVSDPSSTFIKMDFASSVQAEKTYYCIAKFITNAPHALTSEATDVITVSTKAVDVRNQAPSFTTADDGSGAAFAQESIAGGGWDLGFRTGFRGMFVGPYSQDTVGYPNSYSYIKFSTLNIPANAIVESATLRLCDYDARGTGTLSVYRTDRQWDTSNLPIVGRPQTDTFYGSEPITFYASSAAARCFDINLNNDFLNDVTNNGIPYGILLSSSVGDAICADGPTNNPPLTPYPSSLCGNGSAGTPDTRPRLTVRYKINTGPGLTTNPSPADGAVDQPLNLILAWDNPVDDQGDAIKSDVYFGTNPASLDLIANDIDVSHVDLSALIPSKAPLAPATTYYWYVDTVDSDGATSYGDLWQFTTDVCPSITEISSADCAALKAVFKALNGESGWTTYAGWFQNTSPCSWAGIQCRNGGAGGYKNIVGLNLSGEPQLSGEFDAILPLLKQFYLLETLNLSNNPNLTGSITGDIQWLKWLQTLNLSGTGIQGILPAQINELVYLQTLDLHSTKISGVVPSLADLSALRVLDLSQTDVISLPPQIGALLSLQTLKVNETKIKQPIPVELGNLTQLRVLDMSYGVFYGDIPTTLTQLVNILTANFNYNALSIPTDTALLNWLSAANAYDANTQTLAVTDFVFDPAQMPVEPGITRENSLTFTWTPLPGASNPELKTDYVLQCAGDGPSGQYVDKVKLPKTAAVGTVTGLYQAIPYWCKLLTVTHPGGKQKNTLTAETNFIQQITAGTVRVGSPTSPEEITSIPYTVVFDTLALLWVRDYPGTPIPECLKNNTGDNGNGWRGTFQFTYGTGSVLKIQVEGTDGTTAGVAVFEANDLAGAVAVLCNKNAGATHPTAFTNPDQMALVNYQTKPGQKFIIMVVETSGNDGQITLSITDSTYRGCDRIGQAWQASCQVLNDLYYGTGGPNWHRNDHWMQTSDLCAWEGVICDAAKTKIIGLDLARNNLIGHIPERLAELTTLETLDLSYNNLDGEIPAGFKDLNSLQSADLRYNRLSATQPNLVAFLNAKAPEWQLQTIPPSGVQALRVAADRIDLIIPAIPDNDTPGYYYIYWRALGEETWQSTRTRSKDSIVYPIEGLRADKVYEFYFRTRSLKTDGLHMELWSNASPTLTVMTLTPPVCDPTKFTGSLNTSGSIGTIIYKGSRVCLYPVGLAVYEKFGPELTDQEIYDLDTRTLTFYPNEPQTVDISLPICAYQADLFIGDIIFPRFTNEQYDDGKVDRLLAYAHGFAEDYCHLPAGRIVALELIDATNGRVIRELHHGDTLDLRQLPRKLNIRARVDPERVGSVRFSNADSTFVTRHGNQYLYVTEAGRSWQPNPGRFWLRATPFSLHSGDGRRGEAMTIELNIINSDGAGVHIDPLPETVNQIPVIHPIAPRTDFEQLMTSVALTADDESVVRWTVEGLPPGIELKENSFLRGIPATGTARLEPYRVTVQALDDAGQLSAPVEFDWYIQAVPQCRPEDLSATISEDGTIGTIVSKSFVPCQMKVGMASYEKHDEKQDNHTRFDVENPLHIFRRNEPLVLNIDVPPCLAQVNVFWGDVIEPVFGTQRYGNRQLASRHLYSPNGYCSGRVTGIHLQLPDGGVHKIQNGDIIDVADLGTWSAQLIAETQPASVGSVFFQYSAYAEAKSTNDAPYGLPGWQLQLGRYTLISTAYTGADATGRAGVPHSVTFTVINTNQPPQVTMPPAFLLEVGQPAQINLLDHITDDDTALRCGIVGDIILPAGLLFDDGLCQITGIPQIDGQWTIPMRVVDTLNPPVNFAISLIIASPPPPPIVDPIEPEETAESTQEALAIPLAQPEVTAQPEMTVEPTLENTPEATSVPEPEATSEPAATPEQTQEPPGA